MFEQKIPDPAKKLIDILMSVANHQEIYLHLQDNLAAVGIVNTIKDFTNVTEIRQF